MLRKLLVPAIALVAGLLLAGCAAERHEAIPARAQLMTEGNEEVAFTAPFDGMVYVENHDTDTLAWSGHVEKGGSVRVNTTRDRIMLNSELVSDKRLPSGDYRIWFVKDDNTVDRRVKVERSVETRIERDD